MIGDPCVATTLSTTATGAANLSSSGRRNTHLDGL